MRPNAAVALPIALPSAAAASPTGAAGGGRSKSCTYSMQ